MLPYSLGGALASVPIALFNNYFAKKTKNTSCYKYVIITGLGVAAIGFGAYILCEKFYYLFDQFSRVAHIVK